MAGEQSLGERVEEAILVDEVGVETGRYGQYRLKTMYRPVFRNHAQGLTPWGVRGHVEPFRALKPVSARTFLADVEPGDRVFLEYLSSVLNLRNCVNTGVDGLMLFLAPSPRVHRNLDLALGQIATITDQLQEIGLEPGNLVFEAGENMPGWMANIVGRTLRSHGLRIGMDDFGRGHSTPDLVRVLDPDAVRLSGAWFRRIAGIPVAAKLLVSLVGALQREGRQVLIDGIETEAQLGVALQTGADFLQGDLLAPAQVAGSLIDTKTINLDDSAASGGKVVSLFAGNHRPA